jgi:hypothetical protein
LVSECAKEIFGLQVEIEIVSDESRENDRSNLTCVKMILTTSKSDASAIIESTKGQRYQASQATRLPYFLSSSDMAALFPFHIAMDMNLIIQGLGDVLFNRVQFASDICSVGLCWVEAVLIMTGQSPSVRFRSKFHFWKIGKSESGHI